MDLRVYLRSKFNNNVRDYYIGNKCEMCDSIENLELHHDIPFTAQLDETLDLLGYDLMDTDEYSEVELRNIEVYMLGLQIFDGFWTLCEECRANPSKNNINANRQGNTLRLCEEKRWINVEEYLYFLCLNRKLDDKAKKELAEIVSGAGNEELNDIDDVNRKMVDFGSKYTVVEHEDECVWEVIKANCNKGGI